jgi:hypothetical protein
MARARTALAQLFALLGLLMLGLALARTLDLGVAYERMVETGDGFAFTALLGLVGALYLPLAGALLLAALLLSIPRDAALPRWRSRIVGAFALLLSFVVLVVVAARSVGREDLGLPPTTGDLLYLLGLQLGLAVPIAALVVMLAASGLRLWRSGAREA